MIEITVSDYVTYGLLIGTLGVCTAAAFDAHRTYRVRVRRKSNAGPEGVRTMAAPSKALQASAVRHARKSPDP